MKSICLAATAAVAFASTNAIAQAEETSRMAPPDAPYIQVSEALPLPEFIPGLGTLFVDPDTLPAGPFLAYDHDGKLSATVYMTPLEELRNGVSFDDLSVGLDTVFSVDIYYNAGHPGVEEPHAHVMLFHDEGAKSRLAE